MTLATLVERIRLFIPWSRFAPQSILESDWPSLTVGKRRDRPYQAGRSKHWVKVKNRKHPAMERVMEALR
jgi:hypothetical protein